MKKKEFPCVSCKMKNKYDKKPDSLIARFWHWHTSFCPGWKAYFNSLNIEKQEEMRKKYNLK